MTLQSAMSLGIAAHSFSRTLMTTAGVVRLARPAGAIQPGGATSTLGVGYSGSGNKQACETHGLPAQTPQRIVKP